MTLRQGSPLDRPTRPVPDPVLDRPTRPVPLARDGMGPVAGLAAEFK